MKPVLLALTLLLMTAACSDDNSPVIPGGDGNPEIRFTAIPDRGSYHDLRGEVRHVDVNAHRVAVCIYVHGWYNKPYWAQPLTEIGDDGSFCTDVTTGGNDPYATRFAAFIVSKDYVPPRMSGQAELPAELKEHCLAFTEVTR